MAPKAMILPRRTPAERRMAFRAKVDSLSVLRDTLRWRVALVLSALMTLLMLSLGTLNTQMGYADTALLSWVVGAASIGSFCALLLLPRRFSGELFFVVMLVLLVLVPVYSLHFERPLHFWAFLFPAMLVFVLAPGPALAGMLTYGAYVALALLPLLPTIDIVRFASVYGLLTCFLYTFALLEQRLAIMLRYHSDHDALTNCLNRRTFNETLEALPRAAKPTAFLLIDIDHFKAINDRQGHLVGDRVITEVAAALGRVLCPGTPLFRYGGEEFAVLLAPADEVAGTALAERMRASAATVLDHGEPLTVSIGVAIWPGPKEPVKAALARADAALYRAKRGGRNRVVVDAARSDHPRSETASATHAAGSPAAGQPAA
jgi:diguanylate cyclase (GGDEF)-like protein